MNPLIYLDNAATTQPAPEVVAAMTDSLQTGFFNPSSLYSKGLEVRKSIDACRAALKKELTAEEIIFTSGGTEADNLAIFGSLSQFRKPGRVLYSAVEHSAVAAACQSLAGSYQVHVLPVDSQGVVDLEAARQLMTPDTQLICVMQVNNEVGAIQPLAELAKLRDSCCPEARLHVDGVQGFLRLPVRLNQGIDSYALSAHKVQGPKGIGALALGPRVKLTPQIFGGNQEGGLRSGTENTVGIAGLLAAVTAWPAATQMAACKRRLYHKLMEAIPGLVCNGPPIDSPHASAHILNLSFPPVKAQTLMHALEARGVLVSQGSACSAKSKKANRILTAMGRPSAVQDSALRISFSRLTTLDEVEAAASIMVEEYDKLRPYVRR